MTKKDEKTAQLAFWGNEELRMRLDRVAKKMTRHFDGAEISRAHVLRKCVELQLPKLEEMYR
jgi:hypothetical protein